MVNLLGQIRLLVGLKALLTLRSYGRDPLSIVQSVVFIIFIIIFALFLTAAIIGSFIFMQNYLTEAVGLRVMFLANTLLGIYVLWLLVPAFGFRINESYDVTKLLHLPVRRVTLFIASILGNFADLTILIPLAVMAGILYLFTVDAYTFLFNLITLFIFVTNMFIAGQLIVILLYNFIPRIPVWKLLIAFAALAMLCAWFYLAVKHSFRHETVSMFDIAFGLKVYIYFPNGMAASALWNAREGYWLSAFQSLGWLTLNTCVLGAITNVFFSYWYATGNIEGAPVGVRGQTRRAIADLVSAFWVKALRRFLSGQALEVMRKDHLNLLRNRNFLLYKTIPATIGPVLIISATWYNVNYLDFVQREESLPACITTAAMMFAGFIVIAQAHLFAGNIFGLEGRGIFTLFTTEIDKRQIVIGKDAFLLTLYLLDATVFGALTWLLLGKFVLGVFAFLGLMNLFMLMLAVGNFTSAVLPYYFDLERPAVSAQQVILLAIAEAFSATVSLCLLIPPALFIFLPVRFHLPWLEIIGVPLSFAYSFGWLWVSVHFAGPIVERFERMIMLKVSEA